MLRPGNGIQVYLYSQPVDMRKAVGINKLYVL